MKTYLPGAKEPSTDSPDHSANRLSRQLGGLIGRVVFVSVGTGFTDAITATAQAFPRSVDILHVQGLIPAADLAEDSPSVVMNGLLRMSRALKGTQSPYGQAWLVSTGASDPASEGRTLAHYLTGGTDEATRAWGDICVNDTRGLVLVTRNEGLPEPYGQQDSPTARALRLSGVGTQTDAPQLYLQWHQLYPQAVS